MNMTKELKNWLKEKYPIGARVELLKMDDPHAPPIGTKGTVRGVDDIGSIMVSWDNGSSLNVVYGEDYCRKLDSVKTICYGQERVWDSREEAKAFYLEAIAMSEGSEAERYTSIFMQLLEGCETCRDAIED